MGGDTQISGSISGFDGGGSAGAVAGVEEYSFDSAVNGHDDMTFGEEEATLVKLEVAAQIAKWIVGILAIFVFVALLLGCCPKSWGLYSPGEIVKEVGSYLAPIITLVFGFFFGKSS